MVFGMAHLIETQTICEQPRRYVGWPTLARGGDGVLHALFSGDRDGHVCPFGKSYYTRSADDGQTWDTNNEFRLPEAPTGDLGYPSSAQLADGSILSAFYQREAANEKPCLSSSRWKLE